jgi:thiamine biosynthesis lipoprotein
MQPKQITYQSMGTTWTVSIWDDILDDELTSLEQVLFEMSEKFNQVYSRFLDTSLVTLLSKQTGIVEVPKDFVEMLRLYEIFYKSSNGKLNPLVGFSISDLGYDSQYSLKRQSIIRNTLNFNDTVQIIDDNHVSIREPVLFDFGALGKGYFVDLMKNFLSAKGHKRYLIDGSGDSVYVGNGEPITVGLEHPDDPAKVIGSIKIIQGAICASGSNRRKWGSQHHIIDPQTNTSSEKILATWVLADRTAIADGLATALFLIAPETLLKDFKFEYCLLNKDYKIKRSAGFTAELF